MKKNAAILFFVSIVFTVITNAQSYNEGYSYINTSLDIMTGADNIAMGESYVANNNGVKSFFENPAAIYRQKNVSAFYDYRFFGWDDFIKNAYCFSAGITTRTNAGNFGIGIIQYTTGEYNSHLASGKSTDRNRTIILSYAHNVIDNLLLGINAKVFDRKLSSAGTPIYEIKSNTVFLIDLGVLYNFNNLIKTEELESDLSLGLSLQNFGTDYKEEYRYGSNKTIKPKLPRYLRAGFAYEMNFTLGRNTKTNIDLLITGEYKNHINPTLNDKLDANYWGTGIEATLFKIVSFRAGAIKTQEDSLLFDRNKFNWRYGAGLKIPIAIVGLNYPAIIKFDYAVIPINQLEFAVTTPENPDGTGITKKSKNHLYSFSVSLSYNM